MGRDARSNKDYAGGGVRSSPYNYPLHYYCKKGRSHKDWIQHFMQFIPAEHKKDACIKYETLFLQDPNGKGRDNANNYLLEQAKGFRDEKL